MNGKHSLTGLNFELDGELLSQLLNGENGSEKDGGFGCQIVELKMSMGCAHNCGGVEEEMTMFLSSLPSS